MDPYAPCPCGSGKKVKFCCQAIIGEMEKIERLQDNNQPRMALQLLEKLEKTHPANPWIVTHKALALIDDHRSAEAEAALKQFLRHQPEHPFANVLYGIAAYNASGYPDARKAVHRAFRRGVTTHPEIVASLAANVAGHLLNDGRYMAARQHMAFALRLSDQEQRKRAFLAMVEMDGDVSIPYPLRGPHVAPHYEGPESHRAQVQKAHRLSMAGCWQEAASLLEVVALADPESASLWHTIGMYRAWDGDEAASAAALHRAARLHTDFETAVECETLAQLLEQFAPEHTRKMRFRRFRIESVSRLLTQLDAAPRCERVDQLAGEAEGTVGDPAARYLVLDRPSSEAPAPADLSRETVPQHLGRVTIFDRSEDGQTSAQAFVSGLEGRDLDEAVQVFSAAAGDLALQVDETDAGPDADISGLVPDEHVSYFHNYYFPPRTPGPVRRRIQQEQWDETIRQLWPNTPLRALGGRTPVEAADCPELKVALAAALEVLDVFCATRSYMLDEAGLRERLRLAPPAPVRVGTDSNLNTLSLIQLRRLDLASLNREQLRGVVHRALLVRHPSLGYAVLTRMLAQGDHSATAECQEACSVLSNICRDSLRSDEALQWLERGREFGEQGEHRFEAALQWKMRELVLRIDDPRDPQVTPLLRDLWQNYAAKLPALQQRLMELVAALDIEPPWDHLIVEPAEDVRRDAGVWSPATGAVPASSEKKLWLPGDR
jgi:tetratricopeptide (TPR) repeat protein